MGGNVARAGMEHANKRRIREAAFRLFYEEGYNATSYTRIAEKCGLSRSLVQHFFSSKEDFVNDLIDTIVDSNQSLLSAMETEDSSALERNLHSFQLYFAFLLYDESMVKLTYDLLSNRLIVRRILASNANRVPPLSAGHSQLDIREASGKAMGGVYELVCFRIDNGLPLDSDDLCLQCIAAFHAFLTNELYQDVYAEMKEHLLPQPVVRKLTAYLIGMVFLG